MKKSGSLGCLQLGQGVSTLKDMLTILHSVVHSRFI